MKQNNRKGRDRGETEERQRQRETEPLRDEEYSDRLLLSHTNDQLEAWTNGS